MGQDNDIVRNSVKNAACDSFIYWWTDMDGEQFKLYCPVPLHIAWMDGSILISAPSICIKLSIYRHVRAELIVKSLPKSKKVNRSFTCCTHMCVNLHTPKQYQISTWKPPRNTKWVLGIGNLASAETLKEAEVDTCFMKTH